MIPTLSLAARLRIALTRFQARHIVQWDPAPEPTFPVR